MSDDDPSAPFAQPGTPSYWLQESDDISPPGCKSPLPDHSDVVVIGAGMAGSAAAYFLKLYRPDWSVTLLEARGLAGGATGRNGGLLWPGLNDFYEVLASRHGPEVARDIFQFDWDNYQAILTHLDRHPPTFHSQPPISVPYPLGGVQLHEDSFTFEAACRDLRIAQSHGLLREHTIWNKTYCEKRTGSSHYVGGIQCPNCVAFWPAKFVVHLARLLVELGGEVRTGTVVEKVARMSMDGLYRLETGRGVMTAGKVVYCTNALLGHLLPEFRRLVVPVRNQVLAVRLRGPHPDWEFAMSANDGHAYFSQRPDGMVLMGGMRELTPDHQYGNWNDTALDPTTSLNLRRYLERHFPHLFPDGVRPEFEWCGIMGFSPDSFPFIGPIPGRGRTQMVCAGFSGHGMPRTFLCGKTVAQMMAGVEVDTAMPKEYLVTTERMNKAGGSKL